MFLTPYVTKKATANCKGLKPFVRGHGLLFNMFVCRLIPIKNHSCSNFELLKRRQTPVMSVSGETWFVDIICLFFFHNRFLYVLVLRDPLVYFII